MKITAAVVIPAAIFRRFPPKSRMWIYLKRGYEKKASSEDHARGRKRGMAMMKDKTQTIKKTTKKGI
jgi:hypothetical protein